MSNKNRKRGQEPRRAPKLTDPAKKYGDLGEDLIDQIEDEDDDDGDLETDSDQVAVINVFHAPVKFNVAKRIYKLKPGDIAMVECAYGTPRVMRPGADPLPSVVELETGRKVLPVLDPRVDKDEEGVPLFHLQMQARREAQRQAMNKPIENYKPTGAPAQP